MSDPAPAASKARFLPRQATCVTFWRQSTRRDTVSIQARQPCGKALIQDPNPSVDLSPVALFDGPRADQSDTPGDPFHVWEIDPGQPWALFYRSPAGFLVRFPDYADFVVDPTGQAVSCHPCEDLTPATRDHIFLNQVMPLVRGLRGEAVFHASAVDLLGAATAFLAASGLGKSTLAAALSIRGHPILTDDALVVRRDGANHIVDPSIPNVRLWRDSEDAVIAGPARVSEPVSYTEKRALVGSARLRFSPVARPLRAAYVLGSQDAGEIEITPVDGAAATIEWVQHSFLMDVYDRDVRARHFVSTTELAGAVPLFHLAYPRRYELLDDVAERLLAHARELDAK